MRLKKKTLEHIFWGFSAIMLALGLYFSYKNVSFKAKIENKVQEEIKKSLSEELLSIEKTLKAIKETAVSLAKKLGAEKMSKGDIEKLLQESLKQNPNLVGVGAAFEPSIIDEKTKLFAPYYQIENNKVLSTPITYDYTQPSKSKFKPDVNWYTTPLSKGEAWSDPYYVAKKRAVIGEYAIAVHKGNGPKGKPLGIVFVNFNLNAITNRISYLNLGKTGYGFLLSKKGTIISHYMNEYVSEQKNNC
ncbi:hypothetical protein KKA53_03345 [Candidatus Dependentiae bacterium]|nr:hypothetical protein [Candidatus Dependentiae bacterium]